MSRLLDRLVRANVRLVPWAPPAPDGPVGAEHRWAIDAARAAVAFDVSNVAAWVRSFGDAASWSARDFPTVAPPFARFWMEAGGGEGEGDFGVLFVAADCPHPAARPDHPAVAGELARSEAEAWAMLPGDDGWMLDAWLFGRVPGSGLVGPLFGACLRVAADGSPAPSYVLFAHPPGPPPEAVEEARGCLTVCLFALSFLHCKNVPVEAPPDDRSPAERRRWERAGVDPPAYHVLAIGAAGRAIAAAEPGAPRSAGDLKRRLHVCRGHFATYGPDRPLFGRHAGTFWRPAHARGDRAVGASVKGYRVDPPEARP